MQIRKADEQPEMTSRQAMLAIRDESWDNAAAMIAAGVGSQTPYKPWGHRHLQDELLYTHTQVQAKISAVVKAASKDVKQHK